MKKKKKKKKILTPQQVELRKETRAFIKGLFIGMTKAISR